MLRVFVLCLGRLCGLRGTFRGCFLYFSSSLGSWMFCRRWGGCCRCCIGCFGLGGCIGCWYMVLLSCFHILLLLGSLLFRCRLVGLRIYVRLRWCFCSMIRCIVGMVGFGFLVLDHILCLLPRCWCLLVVSLIVVLELEDGWLWFISQAGSRYWLGFYCVPCYIPPAFYADAMGFGGRCDPYLPFLDYFAFF